jgi:hypothetical protein
MPVRMIATGPFVSNIIEAYEIGWSNRLQVIVSYLTRILKHEKKRSENESP